MSRYHPDGGRRGFLQATSALAAGALGAKALGLSIGERAGTTSDALLARLARTGIRRRLTAMVERRQPVDPHQYQARLERELAVIRERRLSGSFLAAWDIVRFARERGIAVSPGRGSAPSSLVAYSLGITGVDPLVYELLFERFLNRAVTVRPSICLDLCAERRSEVIQYVRDRYGDQAVVSGRPADVVTLVELEFEVFGLASLTAMEDATLQVNERRLASGERPLDLEALSLADSRVYDTLATDDGVGVFHLASPEFRDLLQALRPTRFEDLIAVSALCRPGPLASGMVDDFRSHTLVHPSLEPILASTHGVIVYQEQVMRIAASVAGYPLDDADLFRRALGKRNPEAVIVERERFLRGAAARNVSPDVARTIFSALERFAPLTFNRSHAVACALITYRTAYLKTHHPQQYAAALDHVRRSEHRGWS